jgi:two-component system, OmpR family, KDP operon response regulator KdpE
METSPPTILIIDDEYPVRRLLQTSLEARHYRVVTAATGEEGLTATAMHRPQLVLLDLGLPDLDGALVIGRLREWTNTPILILSARHEEQQKVAALDAGADDYLTKPFSTNELLARVRVALRHQRAATEQPPCIQTGDLRVDLAARQITLGTTEIHLTPTEYQVLRLFALNMGRVLTHGTILRTIWGPGYHQDTQLLRGFIAQLRQKIEPSSQHPHYIVTEPGIGYRLVDHDASSR